MQLSLFPVGEAAPEGGHCPVREKALHDEFNRLFDSDAEKAQVWEAWDRYRQEYCKRKADWAGFKEGQRVVAPDGGEAVISILGWESCGLIHIDGDRRVLHGDLPCAKPDQLKPLNTPPELAKELKTLVKVCGKRSATKPIEGLLAQHLPSWRVG